MDHNRIYFIDNPYPNGHKIKEFVWSGRLDESENLWFDFHLKTEDYYQEDNDVEEEEEETDSDWKAKIVWSNYHSCTLSSSYWNNSGILLDTDNEKINFSKFENKTFFVDTLPLDADFDYEDLSFGIYLLGHDSCADHEIKIQVQSPTKFSIAWKGKIALTYGGEDSFDYSFIAQIDNVEFDGFYYPAGMEKEKAFNSFAKHLEKIEQFEWVDRNPKSFKREYKLKLKE